jgi:adenosylcobinamide-phosphate synthase
MTLAAQIAAAYGLDLLCGDPRWFPHPVKYIGRGALALEGPLRRCVPNQRLAGVLAAIIVVGGTAAICAAVLLAARCWHRWMADVVSIVILYTTFATRDLASHALAVYRALNQRNLPAAREAVSRIVGRDTGCLDEAGVIRATVESVAENAVDGVTAPLFFAALGGPVLALAYKAVSTLDSTFGYKNERYLHFGWASARLDDAAAWIPARLTFPMIATATAISGGRPVASWRLGLRDRRKHSSPNSGFPEAAFAGALGVQLGGALYRQGRRVELPTLGEPIETLHAGHIRRAAALMMLTSLLAAGLSVGLRGVAEALR